MVGPGGLAGTNDGAGGTDWADGKLAVETSTAFTMANRSVRFPNLQLAIDNLQSRPVPYAMSGIMTFSSSWPASDAIAIVWSHPIT